MKMLRSCRLLLWQVALRLSYNVVIASLCREGSDIFTSVRENSPTGEFISSINITAGPRANTIRLCLSGRNANWFYLEGRTIRLNSSVFRVLDREVEGSVLIAELICYENDIIQGNYRILVEILNENDNKPNFLLETIQPFTISELTAVNSVVFTVKAVDADGDMISYIIDPSSQDAEFFRIDLPNTGKVVLNKPLDYETRTHLQLIMWAQESNTVDKFNTSAVLNINIEDGDDQYPHFLPCTPVSPGVPVCMNPTYTTNITQKHQDVGLDFSPGPITAEDGDKGINAPLTYTILSGQTHSHSPLDSCTNVCTGVFASPTGDDQGRFTINNTTGEIRLTRAADDQRLTTNYMLTIMVCQVDDRLKYSVASVLVRVLYENAFPPAFNRTTYKGFIIQSSSPASIVTTYGNQVLQVQVSDRDFPDGRNPNIHYLLHPPSELYQVTKEGVLIAKTNQLRAFDRQILQVIARDEESGEEVSASVDIEVLQRGQAVPSGAFKEQQLFGDVDSTLAGGIAVLILIVLLSAILFLLLWTVHRRRVQNPEDRPAIAFGKHPNVVSSPPVFVDESSHGSRAFTRQSGSFHGRQGVYTRRPSLLPPPSSSQLSEPGESRTRPPLPPPSSSSHLFTVAEKHEGGAHTWEDLRLPVEPASIHGEDIPAVNTGMPQRDENMKTD
ncbi:cadherin-related family member 5 isoform X2 [Pundamilia nyererei]|uniref:Cadherin-related family member 5 isoform X2 n=1 Tax=Pundamilia nyererei TaxID=303518 RepID=A0A9Y3RD09_9CICH|nr:PREDICTED: cadherin-related family member 5-like isoform X2 [Pundamilia nyererei]